MSKILSAIVTEENGGFVALNHDTDVAPVKAALLMKP